MTLLSALLRSGLSCTRASCISQKLNVRVFAKIFLVSSLILFCVATIVACKKESPSKPSSSSQSMDLSSSLARYIPTNSFGFFEWDATSDAYQRLVKSAWTGGESLSLDKFQAADSSTTKILQMFANAGIDFNKRSTWHSIFARSIVFVSPGTPPQNTPALVVLFESDSSIKLGDKLKALKQELQKSQIPVEDQTVAQGAVFKVLFEQDQQQGGSQPPVNLFVGWKGQRGVIGSELTPVSELLAEKYQELPQVVQNEQFKKGTTGFPNSKSIYGFGYFDFQKTLEGLQAALPDDAATAAELKQIPVRVLSWATSMSEVPESYVRVLYEPGSAEQKEWFGTLGASPSQAMVSLLPASPLLFLSLDGQTLKRVKEQALKKFPVPDPGMQQQLALLDSLKRVGIVARVSPSGQSLLPIPDLTIALEADNAQAVSSQISTLVTGLVQGSGMPGMAWTEKIIEGTAVKSMLSPMGFGAFLATLSNMVVLTSTEPQMQAILARLKGSSSNPALPEKVQVALAEESSLGNVYIDFHQVGSFMENMGNLLSMYAPQNEDAKKFLEQEYIDQLKKMGMMVGVLTFDPGRISFKSFYHTAQPDKVALAK